MTAPEHFPPSATIGQLLQDSKPYWPTPPRPPASAPNVVVILLDDMGYSDMGCYGGEIHTPHMDDLAATGLRFTAYTTVPMCTPARAALMTGKNPHSVGCGWLTHNDPGYPGYKGEMSLDAPTMAELLRSQGYSTYAVGKWHNTYDLNAQPGGDTSSWPLQRGFDRFYGFMGAETSYFHPDRMMEGNQPAAQDLFAPGYFAPDDYTERGMRWIQEHHSSNPSKPFFLYLSLQTPHTPLQAKPDDIARYTGRYDEGWDRLREQRYERQRAMGVIEPNAVLPERNPDIPSWDELDEAQRRLHARHMEVYAALVDNADQNVGRLIATLDQLGKLDNTLILVTSDNGANSVGGPSGTLNLQGRRGGYVDDPAIVQTVLRDGLMGSDATYAAYPAGWAQVSNTPYRYYKRTPMAGGIRVPLLLHWPRGVPSGGQNRSQWVHVTDILPTVLDIVGQTYPDQFRGLRTRPLDGISFASLLKNADAIHPRTGQYYELQANRGYIRWPWKIVSLQAPRKPIELDNWMLFQIAEDPTETCDLASRHPAILRELVAAFEADATANFVYPLDNRDDTRAVTVPPHSLAELLQPRTFYRGSHWIPPTVISPLIADRSFDLSIRFTWQAGQEGVLLALGDRFAGVAVYVQEGALHFVYQRWFSPIETSPIALCPGRQTLVWHYQANGHRRGTGRLMLNETEVVAPTDMSPTLVRIPSGGLTVGLNRRQAISMRYEGRGTYAYSGDITDVHIQPGPQAPDSPMVLDEAQAQAAIRMTR